MRLILHEKEMMEKWKQKPYKVPTDKTVRPFSFDEPGHEKTHYVPPLLYLDVIVSDQYIFACTCNC